jgi:hypothetical protein
VFSFVETGQCNRIAVGVPIILNSEGFIFGRARRNTVQPKVRGLNQVTSAIIPKATQIDAVPQHRLSASVEVLAFQFATVRIVGVNDAMDTRALYERTTRRVEGLLLRHRSVRVQREVHFGDVFERTGVAELIDVAKGDQPAEFIERSTQTARGTARVRNWPALRVSPRHRGEVLRKCSHEFEDPSLVAIAKAFEPTVFISASARRSSGTSQPLDSTAPSLTSRPPR